MYLHQTNIMTNVSRVCILMVLCCAAQAGVFSGHDFFCRDPDTGKLHATNTTWSSTTFCGNYTCKLRKKNITTTEYAPFRQINVTKVKFFSDDMESKDKSTENIEKNIDNTLQDIKNVISNKIKEVEPNKDRYLNDEEIKTISEILRLMKKSDLDSILEIYTLAQDIYKELDNTNLDSLISNPVEFKDNANDKAEIIKEDGVNAFNAKNHSYSNDAPYFNKKSNDMDTQGSNLIHTSVSQPKKSDDYFIGPLLSTDFKNLPYYYHMPSFQHTYNHPQIINLPCTIKNPPKIKLQNDIRPSFYLPYPFSYIHRYNESDLNNYYRRNYEKYDIYNRNKLPYLSSHVTQVPYTMFFNPHLTKDTNEYLQKNPIKKVVTSGEVEKKEALKDMSKAWKEDEKIPDWQTSPLALDVLEEVRAHVQDKSKILKPLRKNVRLERVGKLIKLEELSRRKRETDTSTESKTDAALYEVLLERTTCNQSNDTSPGFFRYGNLTQPFPECCPQKIDSQ